AEQVEVALVHLTLWKMRRMRVPVLFVLPFQQQLLEFGVESLGTFQLTSGDRRREEGKNIKRSALHDSVLYQRKGSRPLRDGCPPCAMSRREKKDASPKRGILFASN